MIATKTKVPKFSINSRKMLPKFSDEELTALAERVGLTLEQLKLVHRAAHATYQAIGYDLAECNGGKSIKRADLVEVVLDANYMVCNAGQMLTPAIREWLESKAATYKLEDVYAAVAADFPFPAYE